MKITKKFFEKNIEVMKGSEEIDEIPEKIWIFHHTDADGYCGGFVCRKAVENLSVDLDIEIETIACDYSTDYSKFNICEHDLVMIVDLSFTSNTVHYLKNMYHPNRLIWIDHHESSLDLYNEDSELQEMKFDILALGAKSNKLSAALIAYYVLLSDDSNDEIDVPDFIYLVSDWDTWSHKSKDSKYFNIAINGKKSIHLNNKNGYNHENIWEVLYNNHDGLILQNTLKIGEIMSNQLETLDSRYLHSNGFEFNLFGYRVLACNQRSNSLLFGDKINEYDFVCPFVLHKRNGKLIYTYSLFSLNNQLSCKELAEKLGGGGHKGAAGFQLPFNIFTTKNLKFRLFLHNLKNKLITKK